jgi:predicted DNA-binding ribbon-helix-helix protein
MVIDARRQKRAAEGAEDPFKSMIRKRSVTLNGHATSISLEDQFWSELKRMADSFEMSLGALVEKIDRDRGATNLSSALRLAVLDYLKARGVRKL